MCFEGSTQAIKNPAVISTVCRFASGNMFLIWYEFMLPWLGELFAILFSKKLDKT